MAVKYGKAWPPVLLSRLNSHTGSGSKDETGSRTSHQDGMLHTAKWVVPRPLWYCAFSHSDFGC